MAAKKKPGAELAKRREAAVSITTDGTAGPIQGSAREAVVWCTSCGVETHARVARDAKRYGHTCASCGKPTGLEVT